jgi:rsbT co-antagonist protein RsbR
MAAAGLERYAKGSMITYPETVRAIFDNLDVIVWAVTKDGTVTLSEGRQLRLLGIAPGQQLGWNVFEMFKDAPAVSANIRRALAGEQFSAIVEVGGRTVENRYVPLRDERGEVVGAAGMSIDLTEEVNTQREVERQAAALREQAELLDLAHDSIMVRRLDGPVTYWNRGAEQMYGYSRAEALQRPSHELLKTTFPRELSDIEKDLIATGYWEGELTHVRRDGAKVAVSSRWVLKRDERGDPSAVLEIDTDISARKEAEEARARQQEELIRAQALAIAELSTPLIPITEEILVMPIVGVMDSNRAKQVMESLLGGLASSRGQFAVIDITGVPVVDTQVANALIRAAHAARLLGAEVILAGIRPEVAQTLVSLDADLTGITTRGTLRSAIAFALGRRSLSG